MKKTLLAAALLCMAMVVIPGCKNKHEKLTEEAIENMEEMATVLEGIKDTDSAKAAKPKLEKISETLKELKKESDALGKPDEETDKKLKEKYEKQMDEIGQRIMKEMMRIGSDPNLSKEVGNVMQGMQE